MRWIVALAALMGMVGVTAAEAAPARSGAVTAAQVGASPFDSPNVFCTKSTAPPGTRNSASPGVTPSSINITDMSIDTEGLKRLGVDQLNFHETFVAFLNEINKCGGINGRKINLKTALYNPVAPDLTGHLQAICVKATEDQKAFVVVGIGPPQNTSIGRCVSVNHKSIFNGPVAMLSQDFADAKGRLISIYPAGDRMAAGFIADAANQGAFKGKTVGVIGSANTATSAGEQDDQYVDGLKKKGVNVADFEVLPCQGTVCTQGIGQAVSRMKAKDVDLVVMTHYVSITTVGQIFRELNVQDLKASVMGPSTASLHADSIMPAYLRASGTDGAQSAAQNGWYAYNFVEVQNAWRTGQAKQTTASRMCTATLAKALNQREYQFNEADISNGRWLSTNNVCIQVRDISRAIWSLGNNVTTERMVAALRLQKETDKSMVSPDFRDKKWFMDRDVSPASVSVGKFAFPCPLPKVITGNACFLPVDRPARVRRISY
jgi:ABC-type branched-subunit amino acid transport system substrate-binding protein